MHVKDSFLSFQRHPCVIFIFNILLLASVLVFGNQSLKATDIGIFYKTISICK